MVERQTLNSNKLTVSDVSNRDILYALQVDNLFLLVLEESPYDCSCKRTIGILAVHLVLALAQVSFQILDDTQSHVPGDL